MRKIGTSNHEGRHEAPRRTPVRDLAHYAGSRLLGREIGDQRQRAYFYQDGVPRHIERLPDWYQGPSKLRNAARFLAGAVGATNILAEGAFRKYPDGARYRVSMVEASSMGEHGPVHNEVLQVPVHLSWDSAVQEGVTATHSTTDLPTHHSIHVELPKHGHTALNVLETPSASFDQHLLAAPYEPRPPEHGHVGPPAAQ